MNTDKKSKRVRNSKSKKNRSVFSQKLSELRGDETQEAFVSDMIGIEPQIISDYENYSIEQEQESKAGPNLFKVKKIAEAKKVSIDWLCGFTENRDLLNSIDNEFSKKELNEEKIKETLLIISDIIDGRYNLWETKTNIVSEYSEVGETDPKTGEFIGMGYYDIINRKPTAIVSESFVLSDFINEYKDEMAEVKKMENYISNADNTLPIRNSIINTMKKSMKELEITTRKNIIEKYIKLLKEEIEHKDVKTKGSETT